MLPDWLRVARRRRAVFLTVMLMLASMLGALGWRLLAQDEQLAAQRLAEDREAAADLTAAALERRLAAMERDLDRVLASGENPSSAALEGALTVHVSDGAVRTSPAGALRYYPNAATEPDPPAAPFERADDFEFRRQDPAAAVEALRRYAIDRDPAIAAAALVRIARNQLKADKFSDAAQTYDRLATLGGIHVGGLPAALAAHAGRLAMFEKANDSEGLRRTARALTRDLRSGQWPLSYAAYAYLEGEAARWLTASERRPAEGLVFAEAAEWVWERWRARDPPMTGNGRLSVTLPSGAALLVWRASATAVTAAVVDSSAVEAAWLDEVEPLVESRGALLALITPAGSRLGGAAPTNAPSSERTAVRLASATGLPWTLQVTNAAGGSPHLEERRRAFVIVMVVLFALIAAGAWFIEQTVSHELAVADLQSHFVSAVSHEFRTPLTTLCQLSELLKRNRVASEEDRRQYYELLHAESERLRRLVETLLNFGRLQSGTLPFRFEPVVVERLVRDAVADFVRTDQARGHRVDISAPADAPLVSADTELLRSVVWNLLENAVKYSPGRDTVWVEVRARDDRLEIAVRDHGVGIPRSEQRRIFDTFVRGAAARASDVRGTGVGLAMVRQIVKAHGGAIGVESEQGAGSTFTIVLPVITERVRLTASADAAAVKKADGPYEQAS